LDVGENVIVWDIVIFPSAYIINSTDYDDKSIETIVENRTETNGIEVHIWVEVENEGKKLLGRRKRRKGV
jgi:hypothetical protein